MRDYYYILGIDRRCGTAEVHQAYKKLALKFHPSSNDNDPFFTLHYKKIKEAYDILSNPTKRLHYDKAWQETQDQAVEQILTGPPPKITSFFASKTSVRQGDVLTISWEVLNADEVEINLIGEVASNGTQTIRLGQLADGPYTFVEVMAKNTRSEERSVKQLRLENLNYTGHRPSPLSFEEDEEDDDDEEMTPIKTKSAVKATKKSKKKSKKANKRQQSLVEAKTVEPGSTQHSGLAYVIIGLMIFIILVMLWIIQSLHPGGGPSLF